MSWKSCIGKQDWKWNKALPDLCIVLDLQCLNPCWDVSRVLLVMKEPASKQAIVLSPAPDAPLAHCIT